MSVGVEVDALALMLDGHVEDGWRASTGWVRELERCNVESDLFVLANETPQWAEVAEAILELEGCADCWWNSLSSPVCLGDLAKAAKILARRYIVGEDPAVLREAAALLRDGWRPEGWRP